MKYILSLALAISGLVLSGCLPESESGSATEELSSQNGQSGGDLDFVVNPDPAPPKEPDTVIPNPTPRPGYTPYTALLINNGAASTSDSRLSLKIYEEDVYLMKISVNSNCSGGAWQDYQESGEVNLTQEQQNQNAYISIQFKDYDSVIGPCYHASILHDNKGPEISFSKYPLTSLEEGEATEIIYDVQDLASGVESVECRLNGIAKACSSGRTVVQIPGALSGQYSFEVFARDHMGFTSQASISWQVVSTTRKITHDIHINEYRKWDILFVIDNSGSMSYEQKSMAQRTRNFLSILHGLDWQIAITTTDDRQIVLGDGNFVELKGMSGKYLLNSTMNEEQAQTTLSNTLQRPETGSGKEQGIKATYRVVERAMAQNNSIHKQFFRDGAHFATILISDEDESDNGVKNDPQNLLSLINESFGGQKNFSFNSIITKPGDHACINGEGYSYGERYKVLSDLTGGVIGSVCETDYAAQVTGIAEQIRNMARTFTLKCVPLQEQGITITKNGQAYNQAFTVDGVKLSFNESIEPGDYQLVYHCLKE